MLKTILDIIKKTNTDKNVEVYGDLDGFNVGGGTIPPNILTTALKPDIVIINKQKKTVWLHELSIAFEDNFKKCDEYKRNKYEILKCDIEENEWKCFNEPIHIGSRGMIPLLPSKIILRSMLNTVKSKFPKRKLLQVTSKA